MLFGLPISTKEHHGYVSSTNSAVTNASCCSWIGKPHPPALLYQSLWNEGCVYYARTTQPQTIMHLETISNVYGRTVNPYNRNLTPGGSSGGESALLGMRGSIVVSCAPRCESFSDATREWAAILEVVSGVRRPTAASTASSKHPLLSRCFAK